MQVTIERYDVGIACLGKWRMKMRYLAGFCGISLVFALAALGQTSNSTRSPPPQPAMQYEGGMLGFSVLGSEGGQLITLIDPKQRAMTVYHVDSSSGQITLRSVRQLTSDFAIEVFNARSPLPAEIRQMLPGP
jgi:hypothetical protein